MTVYSGTRVPLRCEDGDAFRPRRQTGEHAHELTPGIEVRGEVAAGRPRGAQLDLRTITLFLQGTEPLGEGLRRRARRGVEDRSPGVQGIDEPRPGDVGEHGVGADLWFERRLGEAHDPPGPTPGVRLGGIVQGTQSNPKYTAVIYLIPPRR